VSSWIACQKATKFGAEDGPYNYTVPASPRRRFAAQAAT